MIKDSSSTLDVLYSLTPEMEDMSSNGILDNKLSSKYPITLKEARKRALKSIKRNRNYGK